MEPSAETYDLREGIDSAATQLMDKGMNIAVVMADSTTTSKFSGLSKKYPEALVNVGIAEQNMVGVSTGLSLGGYTAVTANAAPFLLSRANEQVKNDICYSNSNVKMIGLNAGVTYGSLGSTHHILDDISIVRGLGNLQIFAPSDSIEAREIMRYACSFHGPAYIRLDKMKFPLFHTRDYQFQIGKIDPIKEGSEVLLFSMGTVLNEAYTAAEELDGMGISTAVCNVPSIRPLHREDILETASGFRAVATVEEHSVHGGLGSLISSLLMDKGLIIPFRRIGFPEGIFVKAGPREEIRSFYGIDREGIVGTVKNLVETRVKERK